MSILELSITLDNLTEEIADGMQALREEGPDSGRVLEVCSRFRQLGCGLLLADLDTDGFQHSLYRSAHLYLWLLEQRDTHSELDAYYLCKSQAQPLLDALALGQLELARRIGRKMMPSWAPRMEPEEDFHYFDLLAGPLLEQHQDEGMLARFEHSLQGDASARFDAVGALVRRDEEGFWQALSSLTREWEEGIEEDCNSGSVEPSFEQTEAHVFIEGLALVRLAESRGISRRERLPFIPSEAFQPVSEPFPEDLTP